MKSFASYELLFEHQEKANNPPPPKSWVGTAPNIAPTFSELFEQLLTGSLQKVLANLRGRGKPWTLQCQNHARKVRNVQTTHVETTH